MKEFHVTANLVPGKHYMVDTTKKLDQIMKMIEKGDYFTINRPRQYGKTTTIILLWHRLKDTGEYLPIFSRFEGWDNKDFESAERFCPRLLQDIIEFINHCTSDYIGLFDEKVKEVADFNTLFRVLDYIISKTGKKLVLFIDEIDRTSNNELFLNFLGLLRDRYIAAKAGFNITFHSVILAGVTDIKSLKQKVRPDSDHRKNSPWNIAVDFKVDMSFSPTDIETMLVDYVTDTGIQMDTKAISERLFFWTSGYPFLVTYLCKMVAEDIFPETQETVWEVKHIDQAAKIASKANNTLFDVLFKNLNSYDELYKLIVGIVLGNEECDFDLQNEVVGLAYMYGFITCNTKDKVRIHNKIFTERITNYLVSRAGTDNILKPTNLEESYYIKEDGRLDFDLVMTSFQEVIRKKYSKDDFIKSDEFLHNSLRILFLVFLNPIINGHGHSFKEVEIGAEKRLDIVVTFADEIFVVELKIWYGPKLHEQGKQQLRQYMQSLNITKGYMLIANKSKSKSFKREMEDGILMVYI